MSKVKCKINISPVFISEISVGKIQGVEGERSIEDEKVIITRDSVPVGAGLNVFVILHGSNGATATMDVYVDNTKINNDPIKSESDGNGNYKLVYNV